MTRQDVFQLIEGQHEAIDQLFDALRKRIAEGDRRRMTIELDARIRSHFHTDDSFYEKLRKVGVDTGLLGCLLAQHPPLLARVDSLASCVDQGERWRNALADLRKRLDYHFGEEEAELFEAARELLDRPHAQEMARRLVEEASRVGTSFATSAE